MIIYPKIGGGGDWGDIGGDIANQTDLEARLTSIQNQITGLSASLFPRGNWNAATNTPDITTAQEGDFWIVSTDGNTNLDGITDWKVNDWAVKTEISWAKVDNSELVTSVSGKTGVVTLTKTDVGLSNVDNTSDANKPVSTAQATAIGLKEDSVAGKGLSTNDYDDTDKTKVDFISVTQPVNLDTMESDIANKQATLVSGTNIKTVNSTSLLGSGDIVISAGSTVNVETLTADKNLVGTDDDYQILSGAANYNVYLPQTEVEEGKTFTFVNNNVYNSVRYIQIYNGGTGIQLLYSQTMCSVVYDGTNWVANVNASANNAACGGSANGNTYGAAVGNASNGSNYGAAVGRLSNGSNYGAAVGAYANSNNKAGAVAIGAYSTCDIVGELKKTWSTSTTNQSSMKIVGIKQWARYGNTTWFELFLDGSSRFVIKNNSTIVFDLFINMVKSDFTGSKFWKFTGAIQNFGGTVALVGTPTKTVIGSFGSMSSYDVRLTADDTNNSLKIETIGDTNTNVASGTFFVHEQVI